MKPSYTFLGKVLFFPQQGILAIGDLHLGYDTMLKNQGISLNFNQLEETKKELELIIKKIKAIYTLKKIILLGDIKHHFAFQKSEFFDVRNFLRFLEKYLPKENIILIKGNHDTFTLKDYELKDYFIHGAGGLAFTHGDKSYEELFKNKKIKTIITSHIHPAVLIRDRTGGIKKEKFKCFLVGKYKRKNFIVVPSFFQITEGADFDRITYKKDFKQLIPRTKLKSFNTFVVGKNKVYSFGKFGEI